MTERTAAIRAAIWHTFVGYPYGCAMARTYERDLRTQRTHTTKTREKNLTFLNVRVALWITVISRLEAVAS